MTMSKSGLHIVADQDGAAILDIEHGLISTLNPTGAYVWQRLERGESLETVVANLASETGEEVQVVDCDVRTFVESLKERYLLPPNAEAVHGSR